MQFFPVDRRVRCTDGRAAPGTPGAPASPNDLTQWWRSGGDITVTQVSAMRGVANRGSDEHLYVRRQTPSISDLVFEHDDAANGPTATFDMADARTGNERVYQVQYATGHTRGIGALQASVSDSFSDSDVLMLNVSLLATGALAEAGF